MPWQGLANFLSDFDVRKLIAQMFSEPDLVKEPSAAEPEPAIAAPAQQSDPPEEIAVVTDADPEQVEGQVIEESVRTGLWRTAGT